MKNRKIFDNLKEGDKVEYEYWYDEIKKGEDTATVEREDRTSLSNEVWVSDCRHEKRIKDLEQKTNLSNREAELYVLTEELGYNIPQASEKMGISKNNAYGKRGDIKEKIEKAEKTAELSL